MRHAFVRLIMSNSSRGLGAEMPKVSAFEKAVSSSRPKVLVIAGPTAVGKSAAALKLCQQLRGEIISADSVQLYKFLNVGANKATEEERELVPHHMVDIADPACDDFTAGDFFRTAREKIDEVVRRGHLPVVVGGTMMYVRWLVYGRPATPAVGEDIKARVKETLSSVHDDWEAGLALLADRDPKRAAALSRNDWYRLGRALEILESTGTPMTDMPLQGGAPRTQYSSDALDYDFRCVFLYDDRILLNRRIDARCEQMVFPRGNLDENEKDEILAQKSIFTEVCSLLRSRRLRIAPPSPAFSIGYRQTITYLTSRALASQRLESQEGVSEKEGTNTNQPSSEAVGAFRSFLERFQSATRGYAKEQLKWFRKEKLFHWVKSASSMEESLSKILHMGELEHEQFRREHELDQAEKRKDMMEQGKDMKRYKPEQTWLIPDSTAEKFAVLHAERCALEIANTVDKHELQKILGLITH